MVKKPLGARVIVTVLAMVSVALALMCAGLALAWTQKRDEAECWRAAAQFQLLPEGECRG